MADADALARIAYAAYGDTTGGKNYQGLPMPTYDDLGDTIQAAWRNAAGALVRAALAAKGGHFTTVCRSCGNHAELTLVVDLQPLREDLRSIKQMLGIIEHEGRKIRMDIHQEIAEAIAPVVAAVATVSTDVARELVDFANAIAPKLSDDEKAQFASIAQALTDLDTSVTTADPETPPADPETPPADPGTPPVDAPPADDSGDQADPGTPAGEEPAADVEAPASAE